MRKKLLYIALLASSLFTSSVVSAQYYQVYDRYGIYANLGVNTLNSSLKSLSSEMKSLKGHGSIMPVIGGFYELAADKNLSFIANLGFGYNQYAYSFVGEYKSLKEITNDTTVVGIYPDKPAGEIKRTFNVFSVLPHFEISLQSNPIKQTTLLDFRLGLGAAIYLNSYAEHNSETYLITNANYGGDYAFKEDAVVGHGRYWGSTYSSLYIGARWRNTLSNFLNRSTLGIQVLIPFDNPRSGGVNIDYQAVSWTQQFQEQSLKFRINTIGLKYTYNFGRLFEAF